LPDTSQLIWLFCRFSGRVSRAAYLLAWMLLAVLQGLPLYRFMLVPEDSREAQVWAMVFGIMALFSLWSSVALTVKRLHDVGRPGIMSVSLFIPVVSIVAFIWLCIYPGEAGPNRYGRAANVQS
jgi:uncharacterized membrane protein YhaH (DUF805 family)